MRCIRDSMRHAAARRLNKRFSGSSTIITLARQGKFFASARELGWIESHCLATRNTRKEVVRVRWRHDLTPAGAAAIEEHG